MYKMDPFLNLKKKKKKLNQTESRFFKKKISLVSNFHF